MYSRTFALILLSLSIAGHAWCADAITISAPRALGQLAVQLWHRYGYLVTYEEAPVDPEREVATTVYAPDRANKFAVSKPVTFHVERGQSTNPDGNAGPETILPLSRELMQPLVDEYNASGNPSRFAVNFDGKYAHIFADTHMVNGKMEAFQPILATKVSMPTQTTLCYETLNNLFAELGRLRNANVAIGMIGANWLYRLHCSIVGADLTARDVVAQVVHQFSTDTGIGPRKPGEELRITWSLLYDIGSAQYFLSMDRVPDMTPRPGVSTTAAAPPASDASNRQSPAPAKDGEIPADASSPAIFPSVRVPTPPKSPQ
jgi:hypothetical protein